jgi:hypothetical protein
MVYTQKGKIFLSTKASFLNLASLLSILKKVLILVSLDYSMYSSGYVTQIDDDDAEKTK